MPFSPEDMLKNVMNDPEAMAKINSFISSMDQKKDEVQAGIDPQLLAQVGKMAAKMSETDDTGVNLIQALKPYLSEDRIESAEMAIKFLKLSKLSSLIGNIDL